jgi:hypothetical protein
MLRDEIKQVEHIANEIATRSINAAISILSAKIAELEVRINRLSETTLPGPRLLKKKTDE